MKYDLLIFDWDGTLADSTGRIVDSMAQAAKECGLPSVPDAAIQNIIGLGLPEAIKIVWPLVSESQMPLMREAYARFFVSDSVVPMGLFDGAREALAEWGGQRTLAVATGKSRKGLDRILRDLDLESQFAITRCADETRSKPDPLMLQEILSVTGVSVDRALMVGDTTYDLEMAQALGMDSVAMSHGAHDQVRLLSCGPRTICHSISELIDWIETHG